MKTLVTLFLATFSHLAFGQFARIDKDNTIQGVAFFNETYKVEFCQFLGRSGECLGFVEPATLNQDQKFLLVQQAVSRFFRIQELSYKGYMDSLPLYHYIRWSEEKRAVYENLMRYDFNNQRRFIIGNSSYQVCAGCDDDTAYYEIVYNISKDQLHLNSQYYQGRD